MVDRKLIKVCGMRRAENIREVEALPEVDLMGFIFYPSSLRYIDTPPAYLPRRARRVGVFVDEKPETVLARARQFGLHYVQLHGHETPLYCHTLQEAGLQVIKAFAPADATALQRVYAYETVCNLFLFDTPSPAHGGSGQQFDWSLLHAYRGSRPFLLSGGIGLHNVAALRAFAHPLLAGYDLNSRLETAPGEKDAAQLRLFLNELKYTTTPNTHTLL